MAGYRVPPSFSAKSKHDFKSLRTDGNCDISFFMRELSDTYRLFKIPIQYDKITLVWKDDILLLS